MKLKNCIQSLINPALSVSIKRSTDIIKEGLPHLFLAEREIDGWRSMSMSQATHAGIALSEFAFKVSVYIPAPFAIIDWLGFVEDTDSYLGVEMSSPAVISVTNFMIRISSPDQSSVTQRYNGLYKPREIVHLNMVLDSLSNALLALRPDSK